MADDGRNTDDERLLARAEEALTEIKVATGLSEHHEAVLAALRIRLKGDAGGSLEDLMAAAADDPTGPTLDDVLTRSAGKTSPSIDELLANADKPKGSLDDLLS